METNSDAEAPPPPATPEPTPEPPPAAVAEQTPVAATVAAEETPEPAADIAPAEGEGAGAPDELATLAEAASKTRLSPVDEERLTTCLREAILGGRAGVARAIEALPKVPWIVGVRGVEQAWPELTAGFRTQLLSGLAKDETDAARRMRLSLARALFKIDVPVALKVALGVLKDLREKETGGLSQKNAQIVSNVFIGRGKPWLAQLPLEELKPADIDLLVQCALLAAFGTSHPPVTQLGVIKWVKDAGRLDKVAEPALAVLLAGVERWSAKWQNALRREVAELPENIAAVLKPAAPAGEEAAAANPAEARAEAAESAEGDKAERDDDDEDDEDEKEGEERPKKERPVYEPRPQKPIEATEARDPRDPQKERPVYTPRNAGQAGGGGGGGRAFNFNEAIKGIEAHVRSLQNELSQAQTKLRQKEDRPRKAEKTGPIIEGEPTPEELARLNLQLEARNAELQARIDELTQNSEDLAASVGAMTGEPVNDTAAQLRTLLGFKLSEDYADFLALEQDSHDLVVQQHYRTIIRHVFEVLSEVQVPLEVPPAPEQA